MPTLPGCLERSTLGDIFGELHRESVSGALHLTEWLAGPRVHSVHWCAGLIQGVDSSTPALGSRTGVKRQYLQRLEHLFGLQRAKLSFAVAGGATRSRSGPALRPPEFLHGRPRLRDCQLASSDEQHANADKPANDLDQLEADLTTLGLPSHAALSEIRSQFRQLARHWHPDSHNNATKATQLALSRRFGRLSAAYQRLVLTF